MTYVLFLRGINVNGISIKMADLKAAIEDMGYKKVTTVQAAGNVIVETKDEVMTAAEHKHLLEAGLSKRFGYDAKLIMKTADQVMDLLKEAFHHTVPEDCHHYVLLCDDLDLADELSLLFESVPKAPQEQLLVETHGMYWITPKGNTLSSNFGSKVLGNKKYKALLTSRNMNTLQKIVASW